MLARLLENLERMSTAEAGSLGHGAFGRGARPFENDQHLVGGLQESATLRQQMEARRQQEETHRTSRQQLIENVWENPAHAMHDPQRGAAERVNLNEREIEHRRYQAESQSRISDISQRVALTTDPSARRSQVLQDRSQMLRDRRSGMSEIQNAGAVGQRVVRTLGSAASAAAGTIDGSFTGNGGKIAGQMAGEAAASVGNIAGSAVKGGTLGGQVGMLAGPAGAVAGAAVGAAAGAAVQTPIEIAKLPGNIKRWSEALVESQRSISRFSGAMSKSFALARVSGIKRDIMSAATTGGSTADLSNSLQKLNDDLRPLKDAVTITITNELKNAVQVLTKLVPLLTYMTQYTAAILDELPFSKGGFLKALTDAQIAIQRIEYRHKMGIQRSATSAAAIKKAIYDRNPAVPVSVPRR